MQLPASTSIGLLKLLCSHLFGVAVQMQRLTLHSGPREGESIDHDSGLDLAYWSLVTGDVIGLAERPAAEVWAELSGTLEAVVPGNWILPPEFRPELAGIVQDD